jgi:hypothetical protein
VGFQVVNSASKAVTVEPFSIYVRIYRANDTEGTHVYSFDIPVLEGTLPAHSFYTYYAGTWYGTDKSGEMFPDGKYVLRTHLPDQFVFRMEGDDTLTAHVVDYRWQGNASFTIKATWPRTLVAYTGIGLFVNGEQFSVDAERGEAMSIDSRIYLPLRLIGEALGAAVSWDSKEHTAYIDRHSSDTAETAAAIAIPESPAKNILSASPVKGHRGLQIYVNHSRWLEDYIEDGDGYPLIINNRVYVPLRVLSNALKVPIQWDQETKSVYIGG